MCRPQTTSAAVTETFDTKVRMRAGTSSASRTFAYRRHMPSAYDQRRRFPIPASVRCAGQGSKCAGQAVRIPMLRMKALLLLAVTTVVLAGCNGVGEAQTSNGVATTPSTDTMPPSPPSVLTVAATGSTGANVSWSGSTDNVGVTGYIVRRNGVQIATPATTSYADTGLSAATTYSYAVAAYDAAGNVSAQSSAVSSTTPPQPPSQPTPFPGTPIAIPGTFEAENFDLGGEGVAYHDNVPGNAGGQYRLSEDVDIIVSTDSAGGAYVVGSFETGAWLAYTINVAASAQYDIEIRASSGFPNSAFHIEIDGVNVTGTIVVPNTGGWSTFQWVGKKGVALTAGVHVLKVVSDMQYFDLNSI